MTQEYVPDTYEQVPDSASDEYAQEEPLVIRRVPSRLFWAAIGSVTALALAAGGCAADMHFRNGREITALLSIGKAGSQPGHTGSGRETENPLPLRLGGQGSTPTGTQSTDTESANDAACLKKPYPNNVYGRYYHAYCQSAAETEAKYGIPHLASLAMSAHESGFGTSELATNAHNYFGMKSHSDWHGPTYSKVTHEQVTRAGLKKFPKRVSTRQIGPDLYDIGIVAKFRKYPSATENFDDFGRYLTTRKLGTQSYQDALTQKSATKFVDHLVDSRGLKYATDRQYAISVNKTIAQFAKIDKG